MAARILVVDDDAKAQLQLAYALAQEGYEVLQAKDGAEALKVWSAERPSLVLLDVTLPKIDGYEVASKIRADEEGHGAHVPIILLATESDVEHKVRGLRSGADDYLSKPFHSAELLARIKSLLARFAPRELAAHAPAGRVIAFYGAKGGVGTTTIAINSAIALHRTVGRSVVLVDANLQFGDHRVFLDLGKDRKGIVDAVSIPTMDAEVLRQVVLRDASGIALLLAPPSPETAELVTADALTRVLRELQEIYDYVVVDCERRLDETTLQIFDVADTIFVVMTADLSSLKNVALVLEMARNLGYGSDKVQLVLNRSTSATGINVRHAETVLKRRIAHEIANEYRSAIGALNHGTPFVVERSDSALSRAIQDFARSIDQGPGAAPERAAQVAASGGTQAAVKPG